MWTERLARGIGECEQNISPDVALEQICAAAARTVPGCAAALVVIWRGASAAAEPSAPGDRKGAVAAYGASHPDIAAAFEYQCDIAQGPTLTALRQRQMVSVADTLWDERWPEFTAAAIRCGDRSSVVFPFYLHESAVTFGIHSGRAEAFDEEHVVPLVPLLAEQAATALHTADTYSDAAREAAHLQRAMANRAVIDQAKGILMHAQGCDAGAAFERLRQVAQRNRVKVVDVASRLIAENSRH